MYYLRKQERFLFHNLVSIILPIQWPKKSWGGKCFNYKYSQSLKNIRAETQVGT